MTLSADQRPHVIIIGAGIGGLSLAQGLKKAGFPFSVYERDVSQEFRAQGYRLKIHEGATTLKETLPANIWDLFEKSCAKKAHVAKTVDPITCEAKGLFETLPHQKVENAQKVFSVYNADRTVMRAVLMTDLESHLFFGKEYQKYTILPSGKVSVSFSDGTVAEGDVLVGADGVHSRVRRDYLPDWKIVDTDGRALFGKTVVTPELLEKFVPVAMHGGMVLITDQQPVTLFLEPMRFSEDPAVVSGGKLPSVVDYVYWVLLSRSSTFGLDTKTFLSLPKDKVVELSLEVTKLWHPSIRVLLELQSPEQSSSLRLSSALPDIPTWTTTQVTLLGDAVHPMSPTGGQGANTALRSAATLYRNITQIQSGGKGALLAAIAVYEEDMRKYAKEAILASYAGGKRMYNHKPFDECTSIEY